MSPEDEIIEEEGIYKHNCDGIVHGIVNRLGTCGSCGKDFPDLIEDEEDYEDRLVSYVEKLVEE